MGSDDESHRRPQGEAEEPLTATDLAELERIFVEGGR
jgi:hypothetical protein